MKIPKKIKIGGFVWQVEESEKVTTEGGVFGSCHHAKQRIFLDPNETEQKKEHTLLHETMHAIWWQSGLRERYKDTKNLEEEVIQALAHGVYQVLKDNDMLK